MSDITMCLNKECSLKDNCYRFNAKPNPYRQSYGSFKPVGDKCDGLWRVVKCHKKLAFV